MEIKIIQKKPVLFKDLKVGQLFLLPGINHIHMKIYHFNNEGYISINLTKERLAVLLPDAWTIPCTLTKCMEVSIDT